MPLLTVRMAARIQGFPDWWKFYGKKTPAYRQVGNAFSPLVARAIVTQILKALGGRSIKRSAATFAI
jgi:DNA (cytosine-5)-methyltransferase 1